MDNEEYHRFLKEWLKQKSLHPPNQSSKNVDELRPEVEINTAMMLELLRRKQELESKEDYHHTKSKDDNDHSDNRRSSSKKVKGKEDYHHEMKNKDDRDYYDNRRSSSKELVGKEDYHHRMKNKDDRDYYDNRRSSSKKLEGKNDYHHGIKGKDNGDHSHNWKRSSRHASTATESVTRKKSSKIHPSYIRSKSGPRYFNLNIGTYKLCIMFSFFMVACVVSLVWSAVLSYFVASLEVDVKTLSSKVNDSLFGSFSRYLSSLTLQARLLSNSTTEFNSSLSEMRILYPRLEQAFIQKNTIGLYKNFPVESCATAYKFSFPSGYYWVRTVNGSSIRLYCDMENVNCEGVHVGPWTKLFILDAKRTISPCPKHFDLSVNNNTHTCIISSVEPSCASFSITTGIQYSRICGRTIGYQFGSPDAFHDLSIEESYVEGISVTIGKNPRRHIWSFAAGVCPCFNSRPPFVRNNFFCDGVSFSRCEGFCNVVLWDGAGCLPPFVDRPPYFIKELSQPTSEEIEFRVCRDSRRDDEDIGIAFAEIYVQ